MTGNIVMQNMDNNIIIFLKITRDILVDFSSLVNTMIESKEKYGVGLDVMKSINFSEPQSLQQLAASIPNEKLGILLNVAAELISTQKDFSNVMKMNEKELSELNDKLNSITTKLSEIVGK